MLAALLAGGLSGAGGLLILRGLAAPRPRLAVALAALSRSRPSTGARAPEMHIRALRVLEAAGFDLGMLQRDLRVVGRDPSRHAFDKLLNAVVFAFLPVASVTAMRSAGLAIPAALVVVGVPLLSVVGFLAPDALLRREAETRRREFRHALSAYMDLVTMIVAGGGGTESALTAAAGAGQGWAFAELRRGVSASRLAGEPPWVALDHLGAELAIDDLREVAASITLAGEHGAKVRKSLGARAQSLREHRLAEAETDAQAATERMSLPVVLMLFGFIAFVLYPALQFVLGGL